MLNINKVKSVYIAPGATDLRKSINGLSLMITDSFELAPFSNSLFVFCNRDRTRLKILHWEFNGFWLYYRRLERGKFNWPQTVSEVLQVNLSELKWLLEGFELRCGKRHQEVKERVII